MLEERLYQSAGVNKIKSYAQQHMMSSVQEVNAIKRKIKGC